MRGGERVLLDTGPLVALLRQTDSAHEECARFYEGFRGVLLTTEAVVTEAMYLLARLPGGQHVCLEFLIRGGAFCMPTPPEQWPRIRDLMQKYGSLPMDYADATLVVLAEDAGTRRVFTLDRSDFGVYRTRRGGHFEIVP